MEFVGPGVSNLSADFRIGVDVMTTETTCLSSIWRTDEKIKEFYDIQMCIRDSIQWGRTCCSWRTSGSNGSYRGYKYYEAW